MIWVEPALSGAKRRSPVGDNALLRAFRRPANGVRRPHDPHEQFYPAVPSPTLRIRRASSRVPVVSYLAYGPGRVTHVSWRIGTAAVAVIAFATASTPVYAAPGIEGARCVAWRATSQVCRPVCQAKTPLIERADVGEGREGGRRPGGEKKNPFALVLPPFRLVPFAGAGLRLPLSGSQRNRVFFSRLNLSCGSSFQPFHSPNSMVCHRSWGFGSGSFSCSGASSVTAYSSLFTALRQRAGLRPVRPWACRMRRTELFRPLSRHPRAGPA